MRAWILALVQAVWELQGVQGDCWSGGGEWNDRISSDGLRPRAR